MQFMEAALMAEHFAILPDRLKRLTPLYIAKVIKHKRDEKTGELILERLADKDCVMTRESQLRSLEEVKMALHISKENYLDLKKQIHEKWDKIDAEEDAKGGDRPNSPG